MRAIFQENFIVRRDNVVGEHKACKRLSSKGSLYDGDNVVLDRKWNTTTSAYDNHRQYVTPFLDQNLSMTEISGGATYYYNQDGLGSVRNVVNSSGAVQNTYAYTAFGEAYGTPTEAVSNRYQYTGRELNGVSGLQKSRWRTYNSSIGRFMRRDPAGYANNVQGNLYDYCYSSPLRSVDPYGLGWPNDDDSNTAPQKPKIKPKPKTKAEFTPQPTLYGLKVERVGDRLLKYKNKVYKLKDFRELFRRKAHVLSAAHDSGGDNKTFADVIKDAKKATAGKKCLRKLEIKGHSRPEAILLGAKNDPRLETPSMDATMITGHNAVWIGQQLKKLKWCCECDIYLSGCNTGLLKGPNTWPQIIANETGCRVHVTMGYKRGSMIEGTVEILGKKPTGETIKASEKYRPSRDNRWWVLSPKKDK